MFITLILVIIIIACKDDVNSIIRTIQKRDEDEVKVEDKENWYDVKLSEKNKDLIKESQLEINNLKGELSKLKVEKDLIEFEKGRLEKENKFYKSESNLKTALNDSKTE